MSKKKKLVNKRDLRKAIETNNTHLMRAAYVEAAKEHFFKMWSNTLKELDILERNKVIAMVESWADDLFNQMEKGLVRERLGGKREGYVAPDRQ